MSAKVLHGLNEAYLITLDQARIKLNGTTKGSKKLRLRISTQRDMGRTIARVKRIFFNQ